MGGDPLRRSGEIRVEQNLGEMLQQIHGAVEKRLDTIVGDFKDHADKVNARLAQGDTTMAVMNKTIENVGEKVDSFRADLTTQINTLRTDVRSQSDKIHDIESNRPVDRTPKATPALEPKDPKPPQSRLEKLAWKGLEAGVMAVCAACCLGLFLWVVRGNAAKIIDTSPATPSSQANIKDK